MTKKTFTEARCEVVEFAVEDILTTSAADEPTETTKGWGTGEF